MRVTIPCAGEGRRNLSQWRRLGAAFKFWLCSLTRTDSAYKLRRQYPKVEIMFAPLFIPLESFENSMKLTRGFSVRLTAKRDHVTIVTWNT